MKTFGLYLFLFISTALFSQNDVANKHRGSLTGERCTCSYCLQHPDTTRPVEIKAIKLPAVTEVKPTNKTSKITTGIIINKNELRVVSREFYKDAAHRESVIAYEISAPDIDSANKVFCSYSVNPGSYAYLDSIGNYLLKNKSIRVEVHGYADAGLTAKQIKYEERSSEAIAMAVQKYLMEKHRLPASRFTIVKHGKNDLLITHPATKEEHSKNNRVKLITVQ